MGVVANPLKASSFKSENDSDSTSQVIEHEAQDTKRFPAP